MADVGFDSDKHAQTRDDMKRGEESLGDSSEALEQLIDAQDPSYWSDEGGFQAMRTAIVACMKTEHRLITGQQTRFSKFDKDVSTRPRHLRQRKLRTPMNSLQSWQPWSGARLWIRWDPGLLSRV